MAPRAKVRAKVNPTAQLRPEWATVPLEPTRQMLAAVAGRRLTRRELAEIYRSMVDAAPLPQR